MKGRLPCQWRRALVLALVVFAIGSAAAEGGAGPRPSAAETGVSCGVVDAQADMLGYYSELCMVISMGLDASAPEITSADGDRVLRELLDGSIDVALGLLWEGTRDAPVRHGPVVLIAPNGRFGLAARAGNDQLLEAVSWLFHALVEAEALGIDRAAVASDLDGVPEAAASAFRRYEQRLTGQLGLDSDAIRRMLALAGHHGEIYDHWFDEGVDVNRPVELGGQLYAPPVGAP